MKSLSLSLHLKCALGHRWGLIENVHIGIRNLYSNFAKITRRDTFSDQLEVNDTEIFGTSVRIYRPVNKTKNKEENVELLPAVMYYHGGGWTVGSLGKVSHGSYNCVHFNIVQ